MKRYLVANWKMFKSEKDIKYFFENLSLDNIDLKRNKLIICVPYIYLPLARKLSSSNIEIASQNMFYKEQGAFTGEISPKMLKDNNINYSLIGHSERRNIFKEDDKLINKKILSCFEHNITPILCIGEKLIHKKLKLTNLFLKNQLKNSLKGLKKESISQLLIAYEPVWAIGAKKTANFNDIKYTFKFIKEFLYRKYKISRINLLYGGSVNLTNYKDILKITNLKGVLIGKESLDVSKYNIIIKDN